MIRDLIFRGLTLRQIIVYSGVWFLGAIALSTLFLGMFHLAGLPMLLFPGTVWLHLASHWVAARA